MNARSTTFEIICEENQVSEAISSLLHTILFHRSYGKFQLKEDGSYSVGTLGYEEIVCDYVDFTYIRCASSCFVDSVEREVSSFARRLKSDKNQVGEFAIEFYTKMRSRWAFSDDPWIWEIWKFRVNCLNPNRIRLEEVLLEKVLNIIQIMNSSKCYLPQIPNQNMLSSVFDTSFPDVQPYLFKIDSRVAPDFRMRDRTSISTALKDVIKGTFLQM